MRYLLFLAGILGAVNGGCGASSATWASPVPRGEGRVGFRAGARAVVGGDLPSVAEGYSPLVAFEYRRGVADRVDVGGEVSNTNAALGARVSLAKARTVEVSIGLHVRGTAARPLGIIPFFEGHHYSLSAEPDVRAGVNLSHAVQLGFFFRPALVYTLPDAEPASVIPERRGLSLSPELGLAIDLRLGKQVHLVPVVSLATFLGSDSRFLSDDTLVGTSSLALYF